MHISEIHDSDGHPLDAYIGKHLSTAVTEIAHSNAFLFSAVIKQMERNGLIGEGVFAKALEDFVGEPGADPENDKHLGTQQTRLVIDHLRRPQSVSKDKPAPKWKPTIVTGEDE